MASRTDQEVAASRATPTLATVFAALFVVWLPIQTTVALVAYQYGGIGVTGAQAILLLKDVAVAAAVIVLLARNFRRVEIRWYDWVAVAYLVLIALYSTVPWLLGSDLPFKAVIASARIFVLPVELYVLGRLLILSGAVLGWVVRAFLAVSAVAAALTVLIYVLATPTFWTTVIDLPRFIREVQGYPAAVNLINISVLAQYGDGEAALRATWPFTHPVGTGHYFVLPFAISLAGTYAAWGRDAGRREIAMWVGLVGLFLAAEIVPISRGSWVAAAVVALACAVAFRRLLVTGLGLALVALFLVVVPPFSLAVSGAIGASDSSTVAHGGAIASGVTTFLQNPLGLGLGQADHPGAAFGGGESAAVGENLYLALLVSVGPLGTAAFLAWVAGSAGTLMAGWRSGRDWIVIALLATLLGYLVSAGTASPLMRFTTSGSFWLLLGMAVATVPAWRGNLRALWRPKQGVPSERTQPIAST